MLLPSLEFKSNLAKLDCAGHKDLRHALSFILASAFGYNNIFLPLLSLCALISTTLILVNCDSRDIGTKAFEGGRIGNLKSDSSDAYCWVFVSFYNYC
jgi:hypothetical protein